MIFNNGNGVVLMKIQSHDLYHGAVLTQITEASSFKALNKADHLYGHYLVNEDTRLFVKYSKKAEEPWEFRFQKSELSAIEEDLSAGERVFLCLVCGEATICCLGENEFMEIINLEAKDSQTIIIDSPTAASMRVRGSAGRLSKTIAHNSFPKKLFTNEPID